MDEGRDASATPSPPAPPPDLAERALALHPALAGMALFRITPIGSDPLFFGPSAGKLPAGRFDAPDGSFRTCYAGLTAEACFAETLLRNLRQRSVELSYVRARALSQIELLRPLTLVALHGRGLAPLSATAAVVNDPYSSSRAWAAALYAHPQQPDGLCWRSRFDDSLFCVALFDRCRAHLRVVESKPLIEHPALLTAMLDRWRLALID